MGPVWRHPAEYGLTFDWKHFSGVLGDEVLRDPLLDLLEEEGRETTNGNMG